MVERGQHLRFALKAGEAGRVGGELARQDFEGDFALELGVGGAVDLTHAAHAEGADDLVVFQASA